MKSAIVAIHAYTSRAMFPTRRKTFSPVTAIWTGIAVFVGLLAVSLYLGYRVAVQQAEQQVLTVVRLVEEHATSTIGRANLSLHAAIDLLTPADLAAPATMSEARRRQIEQALAAIQKRTPGVVSMSLTDADGRVFANLVGTPPGTNLGDRAYFRG
jgi:hypothetical protein